MPDVEVDDEQRAVRLDDREEQDGEAHIVKKWARPGRST